MMGVALQFGDGLGAASGHSTSFVDADSDVAGKHIAGVASGTLGALFVPFRQESVSKMYKFGHFKSIIFIYKGYKINGY